ncbi:MAG: VOC family protein [Oscillospiraceae bacterium]|nr:VOC family protein [Oscillospiraceae bacterium]
MKIAHIAVFVRELEQARDFFIEYFGGRANEGYHNPKTGFRSYFIRFDDGAQIELMHRPELSDGTHGGSFGYAHIAFSVGSRAAVDQLTERLRAAGYAVISGPRTTGDGYYESCIAAFEGNLIEITE